MSCPSSNVSVECNDKNIDERVLARDIGNLIRSHCNGPAASLISAVAENCSGKYGCNVIVANSKDNTFQGKSIGEKKFSAEFSFNAKYVVCGFSYGEISGNGDTNDWLAVGRFKRHGNYYFFYRSHCGDVLASPAEMQAYDIMSSRNNRYLLIMQGDGNLVMYYYPHVEDGSRPAIWATDTSSFGKSPYRLAVQDDGALVIYDSANRATWSSGTRGKGVAPFQLRLQDDGNLVLEDKHGTPTWATETWRR